MKTKNLYSGFMTKAQNDTFYLGGKIPEEISTKSGPHHVAVTYDAEAGFARLYVDGHVIQEKDIGLGRYAFNDLMTRPMFLGTSNFFDNTPLFEYIQQPGHYMSTNMSVTDFRVYGASLDYYEVFSHAVKHLNIRNLKWDIPTGQRNYIETIERVFKFKTRDRKSNTFNLRVLNADVSNAPMQIELDKAIRNYIKQVSPLHTSINKIEWRNDTPGVDETTVIPITPPSTTSSGGAGGGGAGGY
jgi:hypothetical protein